MVYIVLFRVLHSLWISDYIRSILIVRYFCGYVGAMEQYGEIVVAHS